MQLLPWMVPPGYVVLDIETIAGDPSDAEAWMRAAWKPAGNWKPETIGSRWLEALETKKERLALMDGSPIISVALHTDVDRRCLHWLECDESTACGAALQRVEDEQAMLIGVRTCLDSCSPETVLAGHNIRGFDLPRLRRAYMKHGLRVPNCLAWRDQPMYDTMREWSRFSVDDRPFVALGECLTAAGLPNHKDQVSGADVGKLYQDRRYADLLNYAVQDVVAETALFLQMTGQIGG